MAKTGGLAVPRMGPIVKKIRHPEHVARDASKFWNN